MDPALDAILTQHVRAIEALPVDPVEDVAFSEYEDLGTKFTLKDVAVSHLYAGLAALARDMYQYLDDHPRDDAEEFKKFVEEVRDTEKRGGYGEGSFPEYVGKRPLLPDTLEGIEERKYPSIVPLRGPGLGGDKIVHEWTFKAGKRFFEKVVRKSEETVCGVGGPYRAFMDGDGLLGQADWPKTVAASVMVGAFQPAAFWIPLAGYAGLLVVKTGLKTVCEEVSSNTHAARD